MTDTDARKLADAQNPGAGPGEYAKRNLVDPPPRVRDILNAALPTANAPTGDVPENSRMDSAHHASLLTCQQSGNTKAEDGTGVGKSATTSVGSLPSVSPGLRDELVDVILETEDCNGDCLGNEYTDHASRIANAIIAVLDPRPAQRRRARRK